MEAESGSGALQFLAWLPVLFIAGVVIVATVLIVSHFLSIKR